MNSVDLPAVEALLDNNLLRRFQSAWEFLQAFSFLGGTTNYILTGCVDNGTTVSDGIIVINNIPYEFRGGASGNTTIIVREEEVSVTSGGATMTEINRWVEFGVDDDAIAWSSVKHNRFAQPCFSKKIHVQNVPADGFATYDIAEILPGKEYWDIRRIEASALGSGTGNSTECKSIPAENCRWFVNVGTSAQGSIEVKNPFSTAIQHMYIEIFYE